MLEVELLQQTATVELAGAGPTLTLTGSAVTVELSAPGCEMVLDITSPELVFDLAAPAVEIPVTTVTIELSAEGPQGPPGPAQFVVSDTEPAPLNGFDTLWFQSGATADPDDLIPHLVEKT